MSMSKRKANLYNQTIHIFKKEVKDLFRDKKTWMTSILLPVLLYPVLMFFISFIMDSTIEDAQSQIPIAIEDQSGLIKDELTQHSEFLIVENITNHKNAIAEGQIRFFIEVDPQIKTDLADMQSAEIHIYYDRSNQKSEIAYSVLYGVLENVSQQYLLDRLQGLGLTESAIQPLAIKETSVATEEQEAGTFLSFIIPMFLLISCISGGLSAATDLVAGEKERGTLEALVTTPVGGSPVMIGKMLTVMLMSFISAVLSLAGLALVFTLLPGVFAGMPISGVLFTPQFTFITFIILILVSAMIAALQLSLSTIAKSFKEAQTYNTPLIIVAMLPAYLLMMTPATEIPMLYYWLPIVNVVALFKEVLAGLFVPLHLLYILGSSLGYVILAIMLFAFLFKKESLILK